MKKNTILYFILLLIVAILLLMVAPGQAQDSHYELAKDDFGVSVEANTYKVSKESITNLHLYLTPNTKYKIKIIGEPNVVILIDNVEVKLQSQKTDFFISGKGLTTIYFNNQNKNKVEISIAIIREN